MPSATFPSKMWGAPSSSPGPVVFALIGALVREGYLPPSNEYMITLGTLGNKKIGEEPPSPLETIVNAKVTIKEPSNHDLPFDIQYSGKGVNELTEEDKKTVIGLAYLVQVGSEFVNGHSKEVAFDKEDKFYGALNLLYVLADEARKNSRNLVAEIKPSGDKSGTSFKVRIGKDELTKAKLAISVGRADNKPNSASYAPLIYYAALEKNGEEIKIIRTGK